MINYGLGEKNNNHTIHRVTDRKQSIVLIQTWPSLIINGDNNNSHNE